MSGHIADMEHLARQWQKAYCLANEKEAPAVVWKAGWFEIEGKRYRRSHLERMHFALQHRANAMGK